MKSIRENTFETNSSSTHSLSVVSKEDYEDFENGKKLWSPETEGISSLDDIYKTVVEDGNELVSPEEKWSTKEEKERIAELLKLVTKEVFDANIANLLKKTDGTLNNKVWKNRDDLYLTDDEKNILELLNFIFDSGLYDEEGYLELVGNDYNHETFKVEEKISGVDIVAFGHYGYD
jgi:hypothetical protein